jgi:hypothetical protein
MLQYPEFGGCDGDPYKSLNNLLQCINTVLRRGKQMCREIKNEWERGGGMDMYMWKEVVRSKNHVQRLFAINESTADRYVEVADILKLEIFLPGWNKS